MTFTATISSKNQLTIPIDIARYFNFTKGTRVKIRHYDDKIEIIPANRGLDDFAGMFANTPIAQKTAHIPIVKIIKMAQAKEAKRIANGY